MRVRYAVSRCCCGDVADPGYQALPVWVIFMGGLVRVSQQPLGDNYVVQGQGSFQTESLWKFDSITETGSVSSAKLTVSTSTALRIDAYSATPPDQVGDVCRLKIYGVDQDNFTSITAPAGTTTEYDNLPRTTASVDYDLTVGDPDVDEITGLTAIINEIMARPGWSSGNGIGLIFEDDGSDASTLTRIPYLW